MSDPREQYYDLYKSINLDDYSQFRDVKEMMKAFEELQKIDPVTTREQCIRGIVLSSFVREQIIRGRVKIQGSEDDEGGARLTQIELSYAALHESLAKQEKEQHVV